jgi:hypothetical protein
MGEIIYKYEQFLMQISHDKTRFHRRQLIAGGSFCERLVIFTPDLLRKSAPEGLI